MSVNECILSINTSRRRSGNKKIPSAYQQRYPGAEPLIKETAIGESVCAMKNAKNEFQMVLHNG